MIWRTRFTGSRGRVNWVAGRAPSCICQPAVHNVFQLRWALPGPSWARSTPSAQRQPSGPVNSTRTVGFKPSTYRSVLRGANHYTTSKGHPQRIALHKSDQQHVGFYLKGRHSFAKFCDCGRFKHTPHPPTHPPPPPASLAVPVDGKPAPYRPVVSTSLRAPRPHQHH